ncbi:unnamed protein product [Dovyalis caffra]|uniref:Uncharacterized protein n=1 Tax=Dovyalis caffra TaxID=77055 RepID=A0AAV1QXR5_9ROSI|nr:unnamed protein product [Dovyalis caffra]
MTGRPASLRNNIECPICTILLKQVVVSLGNGPWDQLFGGAIGALAAFAAGIIVILGTSRSAVQKPMAIS